jgi:ribonuclease D
MEDTCHLHQLAEMLEQRLRDMGRLSWAEEEFALLEQVRPSENNGPAFLRVKGAALLERKQLAVLDQLLQWRDEEACRRDRPPFKIVGNKTLLDLARFMPGSLGETSGVEGFSPRLADRYGRALLAAVRKGIALPKEQWPVYPRGERRERDPAVEDRMKVLKNLRSAVAERLVMDSGVLVNNSQLEGMARACPSNLQQLTELGILKNWQREVLGEEVVRALAQA